MRAAYAVRKIDRSLSVQVFHAGSILAPRFEKTVEEEMRRNPRYRYLGELSRAQALRLLSECDVLVQSSRLEGGANTVCEAIACSTPVLASRMPGNTGLLGRKYPGLYTFGDTAALARLIERVATDAAFYESLRRSCIALQPSVEPQRERLAWKALLKPD